MSSENRIKLNKQFIQMENILIASINCIHTQNYFFSVQVMAKRFTLPFAFSLAPSLSHTVQNFFRYSFAIVVNSNLALGNPFIENYSGTIYTPEEEKKIERKRMKWIKMQALVRKYEYARKHTEQKHSK